MLLKRAVVQGTPAAADLPPAKVPVPEPKPKLPLGHGAILHMGHGAKGLEKSL